MGVALAKKKNRKEDYVQGNKRCPEKITGTQLGIGQ